MVEFSRGYPRQLSYMLMHPWQVLRFNEHRKMIYDIQLVIQFYRSDLNDFTSQRHFSTLHKANVIAIRLIPLQIKYYIIHRLLFRF